MSLKASVRALERKAEKFGACVRCDGRGSWETIIVHGGVPEREPRGCAGCGRIAHVNRIILDDDPVPSGAAS